MFFSPRMRSWLAGCPLQDECDRYVEPDSMDEQCFLLGVLRSKSVNVASVIAVRRLERRDACRGGKSPRISRSQEEKWALALQHPCSLQRTAAILRLVWVRCLVWVRSGLSVIFGLFGAGGHYPRWRPRCRCAAAEYCTANQGSKTSGGKAAAAMLEVDESQ
jgi:hypothetical protein